jgi:hypothetical protein
MRHVVTLLLVIAFAASPVFAQDQPSIQKSIDHAAAAAAAEQPARVTPHHRGLLWSGVALGIAGATTATLAVTALRVDDNSTGNAPSGAYQGCVAKMADPIYATNQCGALKAKNVGLLWGGVALGAAGAVLMIRGVETSAELRPGVVRFVNRIRF